MLKNMRVTMLLADHAVVAEGKLYVNGGGWSIRPAAPTPMYLALKFGYRINSTAKLITYLV